MRTSASGTHANSNDQGNPVLLQVAGDVLLGVKGFAPVLPWLNAGGDVRVLFLNTVGDVGVVLKGTSLGFRGLANADLRKLDSPVPLLLRREIYVTAAALGAAVVAAANSAGLSFGLAGGLGFGAAFALRALGLLRGWSLPAFPARD